MVDSMLHRQREIAFAVKGARDEGDGPTRNELTNKNNAAPPRIGRFLADVKAQIHFFEIAVERNRQPAQSSIEKEQTNDADKRFTVLVINLGARRPKRR